MLELVREQTRVLSIASKINSEVEGKLNSRHREYYLRQQLKAIRSQLGEEVNKLIERGGGGGRHRQNASWRRNCCCGV